MSGDVVIAQFSPSDKVPGSYGEVQYGTAGASASGLPLALLLIGLKLAGGTIAPDTQVQQIFQETDADTYAGAGGELATMAYDALAISQDIPVFIASPTPANGAVAASCTLTFGGSWNAAGNVGLRIAGQLVTYEVQANDTPNSAAAAFAAAINGADQGRLPISATANNGVITLADKTGGVRGNQRIVFLDFSAGNMPSGMTASLTGGTWTQNTVYAVGSFVQPANANGFYYKATAVAGTGTSGANPGPTWPTTVGSTVVDNPGANQITWTCWGQVVTGGGVTLGGGSGLESYTALLNTLASQGYDRIALACNDATSLAAWKAAIDSEAGPLTDYLQHIDVALNTTQTASQTLANTTLNDPRFQVLFLQNSETHPSRLAAQMASKRALTEASDPDASYDGQAIIAAPQSQRADWAIHSQLVAMLNNGVTPLQTIAGQVVVCRSITTKCLTGGNPDYTTLDTGFAVVPDFVLKQFRISWVAFQDSNPRVRDDLQPGERQPASGVAYPQLWSGYLEGQLRDMEAGNLPGTCPPILYNVDNAKPVSDLDPSATGRLMTACPVYPMPGLHQVGISIRQAAA